MSFFPHGVTLGFGCVYLYTFVDNTEEGIEQENCLKGNDAFLFETLRHIRGISSLRVQTIIVDNDDGDNDYLGDDIHDVTVCRKRVYLIDSSLFIRIGFRS